MKKGNRLKSAVFLLMAVLLFAAAGLSGTLGKGTAVAMASQTSAVDFTAAGSLTICKYDGTQAGATVTTTFTPTGAQDAAAESAYSAYALEGVEFSYYKVGTFADGIVTGPDGSGTAELAYEVDNVLAALLGLTVDSSQGASVTQYTAGELNEALETVLSAQSGTAVSVKNSLEAYISDAVSAAGTSNPAAGTVTTGSDGKAAASDLPVGLYLVVETAVPSDVDTTTDPFLVSIPMTAADGTEWNYDVYVYPKNQTGTPSLEKLVTKETDGNGAFTGYASRAAASEGDTLSFRVISQIPRIASSATYLDTYTFEDTVAEGLDYQGDVTVSFYPSDTAESDVQQGTAAAAAVWSLSDPQSDGYFTAVYNPGGSTGASSDATSMTVAFTSKGLSEINANYSEYYMVVSYTAALSSSADTSLGVDANGNEVELSYSRSTGDEGILTASVGVSTYGIYLTKTFESASAGGTVTVDASAVQFVLTDGAGNYLTASASSGGVYYITGKTADPSAGTVFSPSSDGILYIDGLEPGTYIIEETKSAEGFSLPSDRTKTIVITETGIGGTSVSATVDGTSVAMVSGRVPLTVTNSTLYELPMVGRNGIYPYLFFGTMAAILAAAGLYCVKAQSGEN